MIVIFAGIGLVAGWLLDMAGDYLLRFSSVTVPQAAFRPPALVRLFSGQYSLPDLAVELVSAAMFALLYALLGLSGLWLMGVYAFFASITIMDYKYRIVLNVLTYPGLVIALVVNVALLGRPVLPIVLGTIFAFGVFYLAARVKPGGLGGGDIKLAALIGATFGFPQVLFALIVSAAATALAIVYLVTVRHRTFKDSIPYAPFLCLGAVAVFIYLALV